MSFSLINSGGFLFLLRWFHFLGGITWIGMLYYINFVHGGFMNNASAPTKSEILSKQWPNVLWYFRWGAMLTFVTGWLYIGHALHTGYATSWAVSIFTGAALASLMWFNVWFVIWPAQKKNMQSAAQVASGGQPIAGLAETIAQAGVASRTNVLFSIPMLFFMGAANHLGIQVSPEANLKVLAIVLALIIGALEFNALKGKMGPMKKVSGVIHSGFGLAIILYVLVEILTK